MPGAGIGANDRRVAGRAATVCLQDVLVDAIIAAAMLSRVQVFDLLNVYHKNRGRLDSGVVSL
jgi:hypothetical protein